MILNSICNDLKQLTRLETHIMGLIIFSGLGALLLTSLGALLHFGNPTSVFSLLYTWGGLFITTPILYCAIFPALRSWLCNTARVFPLDISIYFCLLLGYGYSLYATFFATPGKETFFDVILLILFVWYTSQFIHLFCQKHILHSIQNLKSNAIYHVKRRGKNQPFEMHDLKSIDCGHQLIIAPGEYFPLDGILLEGATQVDGSLWENQTLMNKSLGDSVQAGMRNVKTTVVLMATTTFDKSSFARQIQNDKQLRNKDNLAFSEPMTQWHPLLILTIVSIITCWWLPYDTEFSLFCAISSLLIACPCTVAIVYPITCVIGLILCAKNGIWIKQNLTLLNYAQNKHVVSEPWDHLSPSSSVISHCLKDADPYALLRADIIFTDYSPQRLAFAQFLSQTTRKILHQNVLIALVCHGALLPFTAQGLAEPSLILAGLAISTLMIIANSTRMLFNTVLQRMPIAVV